MKKMNNENFKKGIDDIKKFQMNAEERNLLTKSVDFYMNKNLPKTSVKSPFYSILVSHNRIYGAVFSFAFVLLVGVNTYFFAEKSLPGEVLYPLKVDVIEPLQYTMTVDEISKASLEAHNLDTRLREAELLDVQGKLSDAALSDLQGRINTHADSFDNIINNLNNNALITDDSDVKIDFEAKVEAHSKIIDTIDNTNGDTSNIKKIKKELEKRSTRKVSQQTEVKDSVPAAKIMMATQATFSAEASLSVQATTTQDDKDFIERKSDTEKIIKSTKQNIEKIKKNKNVNKKILKEAENTIKQAEESLKNAEEDSKSGDKKKAYDNLINSKRRAKEANTTAEVSGEIDRVRKDND